jgi:hypothetical protein
MVAEDGDNAKTDSASLSTASVISETTLTKRDSTDLYFNQSNENILFYI